MVNFSRPGHQLIARRRYSLLALTRHHVEPHEEHWFARCRADYLAQFPFVAVRAGAAGACCCCSSGRSRNRIFSLVTVLGWCSSMSLQRSVRSQEVAPGFDEKRALKNRFGVIPPARVLVVHGLAGRRADRAR
jgi:hypothetical protein